MAVSTNLVPNMPIAYSPSNDDDAVVRMEDDMEDINLPSSDTDKANPNGCVVRCTESGYGVYNDNKHQVVFSPDGRITVLDRATGGGEDLKMNFTIKDNVITYHNPSYTPGGKEPEFLTKKIPPEGMELILSDGTTMFLSPQDDGTLDVTITNVDSTAAASEAEQNAGFIATFHGVGSDKPFKPGSNAEGAVTGGKAFVEEWEKTHNAGGKGGSDNKVWVTDMFANPQNDHSTDRRRQGSSNSAYDLGQEPGGFSTRSSRMYEVDVKGVKDQDRWLFYDMKGEPADEANDATRPSVELLRQGDAGVPLFANPNNPDHEGTTPLFGDGTVAGGDATEDGAESGLADSTSDRPTSSSNSGPVGFGEFLTADWGYDEAARRREEQNA